MERVAVDIGGTFTDLVAADADGRMVVAKTLTTPRDPSQGIIDAVEQAAVDLRSTRLFLHGSTIAINTVIERKGAPTALLVTRGFRDAYEIGRGNRPDAYNLFFERPVPLVPRRLIHEVPERLTARGEVLTPLDQEVAARLVTELRRQGIRSIAVCFLHSYANPEQELAMGELIRTVYPEAYISLSHQIMREYREYERISTTVLNAYVGPVVSTYLDAVERRLAGRGFVGHLLVMQSSGGVMSVERARRMPVRMMESGPVAGVAGAAALARRMGLSRVISFDMGGTTAKTSLVKDGQVEIVSGYYIGGYATGHPMMLPVVDIVEVGSGGGSLAWIDRAGSLKVGPVSAGADPGPVCYGRGGKDPTVTDANLVLGRLDSQRFLGGQMTLDLLGARAAIAGRVAAPLGLDPAAAAAGVIRIVDAQMSLAVRAVSVERGEDPREAALVASGGAGPLHAVAIARELNIPVVIIPRLPGQFSAWGMLSCDLRQDLVQTLLHNFDSVDPGAVEAALETLVREGRETLARETGSVDADRVTVLRALDLRYLGQEHTIAVPLPAERLTAANRDTVRAAFHHLHETLYGHSAAGEVLELVGVRVTLQAAVPLPAGAPERLGRQTAGSGGEAGTAGVGPVPTGRRPVYLDEMNGFVDCAVYWRDDLEPGHALTGPAVVEETASTTVIYAGDRLTVTAGGELLIQTGSTGRTFDHAAVRAARGGTADG